MSHEPHAADEQLLTKVRKLLAMAENTSNANEADAFSRKVAEMVAEHRIDLTRLKAEAGDSPTVIEVVLGRGAYVRGRLALLTVLGSAHGCQTIYEVRKGGTVAFLTGFPSDLAVVQVMYNSLHSQASSRMARERRATPAATQEYRRSFLIGFSNQISKMLKATEQRTLRNAAAMDFLPALRTRDQRVSEAVKERFPRVGKARGPKPATRSGRDAGVAAADKADVGRARIVPAKALGSRT